MVTNDNDEIKQKASEKEWDYSASFKDKADDYENYLMNEARADTAKQIFKELGDIIAFSGKLTELRSDKVYRAIREEDYQALKKEHKVD